MGRILRFLGLALLLATSALAGGCSMRMLHVVIPDFEASQVVGVNVWKVDAALPEDAGVITFGALSTQDFGAGPIELIEYQIVRFDGTVLDLRAQVIRDPAAPGGIEVYLMFPKEVQSGWFKVSTYNAYGMSPLSTEQSYLL